VEGLVKGMLGGFYQGRRVLITGHTGFKGSWLGLWLKHLGATVHGFSLPPPTNPNLHEVVSGFAFDRETLGDIRALALTQATLAAAAPELVFHLAAQPLVRQSYTEPLETLTTNTLGTAHVLEAVRRLRLPCAVVVVTTDKCYANSGAGRAYQEGDPLGGHDLYSTSKAAAELVVDGWRRSFFEQDDPSANVASARAGNVLGGGDYGHDRLVPDCIRALLAGRPIEVRNPSAIRPWQHVLDCLSGYLVLGARLAQAGRHSPLASAFNFGPASSNNPAVSALVEELLRLWPGAWQSAVTVGAPHEAQTLNLAIEKAGALLGWIPVWGFPETVRATVSWYRERHVNARKDMVEFSLAQIEAYVAAARAASVPWADSGPG
jgi:CDP-glucose 4,6-dehydratase